MASSTRIRVSLIPGRNRSLVIADLATLVCYYIHIAVVYHDLVTFLVCKKSMHIFKLTYLSQQTIL